MARYDDREYFIPISKHHLINALAKEYDGETEPFFRHFVDILEALYHFKFHTLSEELKEAYEPFNPDKDVTIFAGLTEGEEEKYRRELIDLVAQILEKGNFSYLNEQDLSDLLSEHGHLGIQIEVDQDQYRHFSLYVRGEGVRQEELRTWYTLWLGKKMVEVPYYKRVVLMLQGIRMDFPPLWMRLLYVVLNLMGWKGAKKLNYRVELHKEITLKVFKDIRKDSLQMLFPYVRMSMTLFDRLKIGVPFVGGVILVIFKLMVAAALSPITVLVLLGTFIGYIVKSIFGYQTTRERYVKKLTENLYYNSLNNNQGVFSYLVDSAEEEEVKEALLALHFLWNKQRWSLGQVTLPQLDNQIEEALEEHFGVKVDFDIEDALGKLGYREEGENLDECEDGVEAANSPLGLLIKPQPFSVILEEGAKKGDRIIKAPAHPATSLPLQGTVEIQTSNGTDPLKLAFSRHPWKFEIQNTQFQGGARIPHPLGSVIAWHPEKAYTAETNREINKKNSSLEITKPSEPLPLLGKALLGQGEKEWTFHYRRRANDNRLYFWKPLENFHSFNHHNPILVRLIPPSFELQKSIGAGSTFLPCPADIDFPPTGIVNFLCTKGKEHFYSFIQDYVTAQLNLKEPLKVDISKGTKVSLSSLTAFLSEKTYSHCHSITLKDARLFQFQGTLRLGPGTDREEVLEFRREIFELQLQGAPRKKHPLGSTIFIYSENDSLKVKLVQTLDRKRTKLLVYGSLPFPEKGKAVFEPGTKNHEELEFESHSKILYLPESNQYPHQEGEKVQQDILSTPLIQPLFPSSRTLIVKDSSPFPLQGQAFLEQDGKILEGPISYRRPSLQNPHTLFIVDHPPRSYPQGTPIRVVTVEKVAETDLHVDSRTLEADFSQTLHFPQEGKVVLEPGSLYEEVVSFQRFPHQIELTEALPQDIPPSTLCKLHCSIAGETTVKARRGEESLELKDISLFPEEGEIKVGEQIVGYQKRENLLFLKSPLQFHHSKNTLIRQEGLPLSLCLTESAKRGERRISINRAEGVPEEGTLHLGTGARTRKYSYQKKGKVLFLNKSLEISYRRKTPIFFPDFQLGSHISPGEKLIEIVEGEALPKKGVLLIDPDSLHSSESSWRNLLYKIRPAFLESREERVEFEKREEILWLEEPLKEDVDSGERVELITLSPQSFGHLEPLSIQKASIWLDNIWDNIFPDSNQFRSQKMEPTRSRRRSSAKKILKGKKK